MLKDCGETTLLLDESVSGDERNSLFERQDRASERVACEASVLDEESEPQFHTLEPTASDQASVRIIAGESAVSTPADRGGDKLAASSASTPRNSAFFSRGLVDTYFRQMGRRMALARGGDCPCQAHRGVAAGDADGPVQHPNAH